VCKNQDFKHPFFKISTGGVSFAVQQMNQTLEISKNKFHELITRSSQWQVEKKITQGGITLIGDDETVVLTEKDGTFYFSLTIHDSMLDHYRWCFSDPLLEWTDEALHWRVSSYLMDQQSEGHSGQVV